ncbi:MAG: TolC family protein [Pseudomonadota bacterium]
MRPHTSRLLCLAGSLLLILSGCVAPSSRENVEATAKLVASQTSSAFSWRKDEAADAAARKGVELLLNDGLTLDKAVAVSFLISPDLQLALEKIEVARSEVVAAGTPPNPLLVMGMRDTGGNFSAYYPSDNLSVGIIQNVIGLLNMPDRMAVAGHELERTRLESAQRITVHGVLVAQAWLEYCAALRVQELRNRSAVAAHAALEAVVVNAANGNRFTPLDVGMERNAVFSVEGSALRAEVDTATARERLAELLGLGGWRDDWQLAGSLPPLPATDPDPSAIENQALQRRFDVRAATKAIDARLRALATQRRFRWINELELGVFRDSVVGGTTFIGPNAVIELPLFDQRQAQLLAGDAQLRSALRTLETIKLTARSELRTHAAEMRVTRALLEKYETAILPNQRQMLAALGSNGEQGEPDRLRLRLSALSTEEEQTGLLRDYWRARSAFALAAGDWEALAGLHSLGQGGAPAANDAPR